MNFFTKFIFGHHFETVQKFCIFFAGLVMVVISVCINDVKIIIKFWWENGFLKEGPMKPSYTQTEGLSTLCS